MVTPVQSASAPAPSPVKQRTPAEQQEQQQLKETLDRMVQAFNDFHGQIELLKKQQQDVIRHIRSRIDQEKIEQIKNLLKGSQQ